MSASESGVVAIDEQTAVYVALPAGGTLRDEAVESLRGYLVGLRRRARASYVHPARIE
jgi:hypothetical protein